MKKVKTFSDFKKFLKGCVPLNTNHLDGVFVEFDEQKIWDWFMKDGGKNKFEFNDYDEDEDEDKEDVEDEDDDEVEDEEEEKIYKIYIKLI